MVLATVDTNVLVSGLLLQRGHPYSVIDTLRRDGFVLVTSKPLIEEYRRVLLRPRIFQRYRLTEEELADFFVLVLAGRSVQPLRRAPVRVRDEKDEIVLATALAGRADYLVTGDQDLLVLNGHPKLGDLRILTAREFLEILKAG